MHSKTIAAACICSMLLMLPVPASAEDAWREAYRQVLSEYPSAEGYLTETAGEFSADTRWDLCDINGDTVPELFISPDASHAFGCRVYSYTDGEVKVLETREGQYFGEYGLTKVCQDKHMIRAYHFGTGTEMIGYYEFDGTDLIEKDRFVATNMHYSKEEGVSGSYQRNGEEISADAYYAGIDAYEVCEWEENVGRAYTFDDLSPLDTYTSTGLTGLVELEMQPDQPPSILLAAICGILSAIVLTVVCVGISEAARRK